VQLPAKPQIDRDGKQLRDAKTGKPLYASILEFQDYATRAAFSHAVIAALLDFCPRCFAEEAPA
jgi:hypothetical protein